MNERQLKSLFCSSLRSNHIKNNELIPTSEIRIVEEAYFRNFDLLIAAVTKEPNIDEDNAHYDNMLVRTQLLRHFARHEKCLPSTLICYTGIDDCFEVVSTFDRIVSNGVLNLRKINVAKAVGGSTSGKIYRRLVALEHIF